MNRKGGSLFEHPGIILPIFFIVVFVIIIIPGYANYVKKVKSCQTLLDTSNFVVQYSSPEAGNKMSNVVALINGSNMSNEVDISIIYTAYKFDTSNNILLKTDSLPSRTLPFTSSYSFDTPNLLSQLGNKARVCVKAKLVCKTNWLGFLTKPNPSKDFEEKCSEVAMSHSVV